MLILKDQFSKFKSKLHVEYLLNSILGVIIAFIVMTAIYGLVRPISIDQFHQVTQISKQQSFPETQEMAEALLTQKQIHTLQFYRLMHAYHFESSRINQYPAMALEDE